MARTVLPIVGGIAGFFIGGPVGAQVGFALGGVVGNAVDPVVNQGPKIGETGAQTSSEGAPRAIVYATAHVTGNVIATGPLIKTTETESQGKGGPVNETEHGYRNYVIRICEGPIGAVLRVWQDDKLVYDVRDADNEFLVAMSQQWLQSPTSGKIFYLGTEDQLPDVFSQLNITGIGETPAYRGSAYMVVGLEDLTDRRGAIPQYRFEVAGSTIVEEIRAPLVINEWTNVSRPVHEDGDTSFTVLRNSVTYDDFEEGAVATAAAAVADGIASASESTLYLGYYTSLNEAPNRVEGGATVAGSPETVTYLMGPAEPANWDGTGPSGPLVCAVLEDEGVEPGDGQLIGMWDGDLYGPYSETNVVLSKLFAAGTVPASGPYSHVWNNCVNYPLVGGDFPVAAGTPAIGLVAERLPSPPPGYTKVIGTAKQLCEVSYRDGALYQNALGPVLLPDDPNYDNVEFWEDARDAAILAGLLQEDVGTPAVVAAYAVGASTVTGLPVQLGVIVADIHDRCGIEAEKYDVSELTDLVDGLVLAGDYTGQAAINTLRAPYFFDKAEYDKKLWYPKRGKPVVYTLTIDDLVEEPDTAMREQAIEYPKKLHLFYQHAESGYATVKATSSRSSPDARVVGEQSLQVPVVLNEDQAAQTASKLHKVAWAEAQGEVVLSVSDQLIGLVPSDNVGLVLRDQVKRLRIEQWEYADGVIKLTLKHDRQSAYTSHLTGIPIPLPTLPPSTIVGDTEFEFLDISSRIDTEDDLNYYIAATAEDDGWYGARIQRSIDGGENFVNAVDISTRAVLGVLQNSVSNASEHYTDHVNTVQVTLDRPEHSIEDISEAQFLSEGGSFALEKSDGSWEIMQYRDVEDDSNGTYTLSVLHRGRLYSIPSAHSAGARFVLLPTVTHVLAGSSLLNRTLTHRAISFGQSPEDATEGSTVYVGRSQREWPVAYLRLTRSGDDLTARWTPRHRFGTDDAPVASVNFQGYRIRITDGSATPVQFDQSSNTFSYDVSGFTPPVTVTVWALNRITGAGPSVSLTEGDTVEVIGDVPGGGGSGGSGGGGGGGEPHDPFGPDAIVTDGEIDADKYAAVAADYWDAIGYRFGSPAPSTPTGTAYYERDRIPFPIQGPPDNNPNGRPASYGYSGTYQEDLGVWQNDAGGFSSNNLTIPFVADAPSTHIGVANIEASDVSNGMLSITPELPWTRYGEGLDAVEVDYWRDLGYPTHKCTAYARNEGRPGWGCQTIVVFQPATVGGPAFVATTGANTMQNRMGFYLPSGLVCTAMCVTNSGEFALFACWDAERTRGVLVVAALTSLGDGGTLDDPDPYEGNPDDTSWGEARDAMPGRPGISNYAYGKVIGQIDLPTNMRAPTEISCTTSVDRADYMPAGPAHSGCWADATYPSFISKDRTDWADGGFYENATARSGVAIVVSRTEQTACFIDLQPLFAYYRYMYFESDDSTFSQTLNVGDGAGQWPFTFAEEPSQTPEVLSTINLTQVPTAVHAAPWGPSEVYIGCENGSMFKYSLAGSLLATYSIGDNITCIRQMKEKADSGSGWDNVYTLVVTCRGERAIKFVDSTDGSILKTLQPTVGQLQDPIAAEDIDNNTAGAHVVSVADYSGERVVGFMYGPFNRHSTVTPTDNTPFGPGPTGTDVAEYGSGMSLPGKPWGVYGANIS